MPLLLGLFLAILWVVVVITVGAIGLNLTWQSATSWDTAHLPLWRAVGVSIVLGLATVVVETLILGLPLLFLGVR